MSDIIQNGMFAVICGFCGIGVLYVLQLCGVIGALGPAGGF